MPHAGTQWAWRREANDIRSHRQAGHQPFNARRKVRVRAYVCVCVYVWVSACVCVDGAGVRCVCMLWFE